MKRYVSVFEMIVRSSIYKVLLVFLFMLLAEGILLFYAWNQSLAVLQPNLEEWIDQSYMVWIFAIASALLTGILSVSGKNKGSCFSYTLQRLRIPKQKVCLLQCIYNSLCYVLLWGIQVIGLFFVSAIYKNYKQDVILTNQTVFLAFYKNNFMHSLLPMGDIFGWCSLLFFILMLGICTANFSRQLQKGKKDWMLIICFEFSCFFFIRKLGANPLPVIIGMLIFTIICLLRYYFSRTETLSEKEEKI